MRTTRTLSTPASIQTWAFVVLGAVTALSAACGTTEVTTTGGDGGMAPFSCEALRPEEVFVDEVNDVAFSDTHAYYLQGQTVRRQPIDGGVEETLYAETVPDHFVSLAGADAIAVYGLVSHDNQAFMTVVAVPLEGGGDPIPLGDLYDEPHFAGSSGGALYFATKGGEIFELPKQGGDAVSIGNGVEPKLDAGGGKVIYSDGNDIFQVDAGGANATKLLTLDSPPLAIDLEGSLLFLATSTKVIGVTLATGGTKELGEKEVVGGVAHGDGNVYFSACEKDDAGNDAGSIQSVPVEGGEAKSLTCFLGCPKQVYAVGFTLFTTAPNAAGSSVLLRTLR